MSAYFGVLTRLFAPSLISELAMLCWVLGKDTNRLSLIEAKQSTHCGGLV